MIKLNNYSKLVGRRGKLDYYRWRVFVDEDSMVLNSIEEVVYQLHPTFPNPQRSSTNREDRFALETEGWGEFSIVADIRFRNADPETVTYWLDLSKDWPEGNH